MASIYLPPIARKKKVDGWPRQNTSRVFPDMQDDIKQEDTSYKSEFIRHNVPPTPQRIASASRKNKPQPKAVTFLRQNPRFVCEPICHVDTVIQDDANNILSWWPDETMQRPVKKPMYSLNSTSRADYRNFTLVTSQTGYLQPENLSITGPKPRRSIGIIPGYRSSDNAHDIFEKISYEHQFNSRLDPSHPIRGKRHGCFVWKVVTPTKNKYGRDRSSARHNIKDMYELANADGNDDNMDAKSMVSTISDKTTKVVSNSSKKLKENDKAENSFGPYVKNYAWISPAVNSDTKNHQPVDVAKQQEETMELSDTAFEMTDEEMKNVIKPSRPRRHSRHSPPPHSM